MSLSFVARTRFQSVLDALEEDRFFISGRSAKRDDVYPLGSLSVDDRNGYTSEKAERHKALLSIAKSIILESEGRTFKHPW
jgi:hypothetical protein